jgi:hypothetical protein
MECLAGNNRIIIRDRHFISHRNSLSVFLIMIVKEIVRLVMIFFVVWNVRPAGYEKLSALMI